MTKILEQHYIALKASVELLISDVHRLAIDIQHEEMIDTLNEIRNRLQDPFMFVVVGEVKAGKSSFINALLETDRDICAVAPSPMTDTIQQIVYGEETSIQEINPYLKRIYEPVDILKDIAIVDTPGTNTIIEHHQEITERFIPSADLIVFVFEAKNPYRESSWEFFNLIRDDWRKKVIFVLQQKDLLDHKDLLINEDGVREYAIKKGVEDPVLFSVSAKMEQEGKTDESGYKPLRSYVRTHITGGRAPILKLESSVNTAANFLDRIETGVSDRALQLKSDKAFREQIDGTLQRQGDQAEKQVNMLIENLGNAFDAIAEEQKEKLASGLSFFSLLGRSISSIFSKKSSLKEWLTKISEDIENDLQSALSEKINNGVADLADSVQEMVRMIDLEIKSSETILKDDHELFANIAERRSNVMLELRQKFEQFLKDERNFKEAAAYSKGGDISPKVATGSGLAVIGIILTAVTNGIVMDITGGVLTAIGLVFASVSVGINKKRILKRFDQEMKSGRKQIDERLRENLMGYIQHLKDKILQHFSRFDTFLDNETKQIATLQEKISAVDVRITEEQANVQRTLDSFSS